MHTERINQTLKEMGYMQRVARKSLERSMNRKEQVAK